MKQKNTYLTVGLTALVHILGIFLLSTKGFKAPPKPPKKMVVFAKVVAPPPSPVIVHSTTPVQIPIAKAAKISPPTPKIVQKKKPSPKKKKAAPSKNMRANLEKNLAKIAKTTPKTASNIKPQKSSKPQAILPSPLMQPDNTAFNIFSDRIISTFREKLILPEKGAVKLSITVQANGRVGIIELIHSESEKNLAYLQSMLPLIMLPEPEGAKEVTFVITFCDD